jgi:hypothetical protein
MWVFYPLSFLGFNFALIVFTLINATALLYFAKVVFEAFFKGAQPEWLSQGRLTLLLFSFVPFLKCILFAQTLWLPLLGIALAVKYFNHSRLLAGCCLSFSTIKPHLFLPLYAFILVVTFIKREPKLGAGFTLGLIYQSLFFFFVNDNGHKISESYLTSNPHGLSQGVIFTAALLDFISNCVQLSWVKYLGVIPALLLGVYLTIREEDHKRLIFLKLLPLGVLLTPYAWLHDFLPLFPLMVMLVTLSSPKELSVICTWSIINLVMATLILFNLEAWSWVIYLFYLFLVKMR